MRLFYHRKKMQYTRARRQLLFNLFYLAAGLFQVTMVYEIRASADMIRANCLFSAVGWKEWGRKKDRKRLFPTTPPASSLKRGFARIISAFTRLLLTMVSRFTCHLSLRPLDRYANLAYRQNQHKRGKVHMRPDFPNFASPLNNQCRELPGRALQLL